MRIRTGIRPGDWLDVGPARGWELGGMLVYVSAAHHTRATAAEEAWPRRASVAVLPIARAKGHASLGSDA